MAQADWDLMLVRAFRRNWVKEYTEHHDTMYDLRRRYLMAFDDYDSLLRTPKFPHQSYRWVVRFVCGYLPNRVTDWLLSDLSDIEVVERIKTVVTMSRPKKQQSREGRIFRDAKLAFQASAFSSMKFKEHCERATVMPGHANKAVRRNGR